MWWSCGFGGDCQQKADSPKGNDRKKSNGKSRSFAALRMTMLWCGLLWFPPIPQKRGMDGAPAMVKGIPQGLKPGATLGLNAGDESPAYLVYG
jgi:hypothetical protein